MPAPISHSFNIEPASFDFQESDFKPVVYNMPSPLPLTAQFNLPSFHIVGVYQEFIFADMSIDQEEGLFIVDTRGALSRIAFEDLTSKRETKAASQQLLTPFFLELSHHEAATLLQLIPALQTIGFEIREFGKAAFLVESAPATLALSELEEFFREAVKEEEEDPTKMMRKLARLASRSSLSKKNPLTLDLAKEILRRLFQCETPRQCPFGREIFAPLSKEDIQKKFL